jgi:hypothetical protein
VTRYYEQRQANPALRTKETLLFPAVHTTSNCGNDKRFRCPTVWRGRQVVRQLSVRERFSGSSPTTGTKPKRLCAKVFPQERAMTGTKTGTKFSTDAKSCQRTPTRP